MSEQDTQHEREEVHLLGKLQERPVPITHSATIAIARRLRDRGEAMLMHLDGALWLEITAHGRRRLNDLHETRSPADAWDAIYGMLCTRGDRLWAAGIMREIESVLGSPLPAGRRGVKS
jgi:hypothetical protein